MSIHEPYLIDEPTSSLDMTADASRDRARVRRMLGVAVAISVALAAPASALAAPSATLVVHGPSKRCAAGYHLKAQHFHGKRHVSCVKNKKHAPVSVAPPVGAPTTPAPAPAPAPASGTPSRPPLPPLPTIAPPSQQSSLRSVGPAVTPGQATCDFGADAIMSPAVSGLAQTSYDQALVTVDALWARPTNGSAGWRQYNIGTYYYAQTLGSTVYIWSNYNTGQPKMLVTPQDSWDINPGWTVDILQLVAVNGQWSYSWGGPCVN